MQTPSPPPRIIRLHVKVPCLEYAPPPAPLEEHEKADDEQTHPRILCGAMDPLDCDAVRRGAWADYGHEAAYYLRAYAGECFKVAP